MVGMTRSKVILFFFLSLSLSLSLSFFFLWRAHSLPYLHICMSLCPSLSLTLLVPSPTLAIDCISGGSPKVDPEITLRWLPCSSLMAMKLLVLRPPEISCLSRMPRWRFKTRKWNHTNLGYACDKICGNCCCLWQCQSLTGWVPVTAGQVYGIIMGYRTNGVKTMS